jgi:hypothetical protein
VERSQQVTCLQRLTMAVIGLLLLPGLIACLLCMVAAGVSRVWAADRHQLLLCNQCHQLSLG